MMKLNRDAGPVVMVKRHGGLSLAHCFDMVVPKAAFVRELKLPEHFRYPETLCGGPSSIGQAHDALTSCVGTLCSRS